MNLPIFSLTRALAAGSLILAAGVATTSVAQPATNTAKPVAITPQEALGAFDDDPRPVTAVEQIVNSAGLDAAKLAAAQRDLLAILQKPDAPANERQAAAQQLGVVLLTGDPAGHAATLNALAPMLADPARSGYARLALDRAAGASIDTLYLQALRSSSGRTRLGLVDALGTRGVVAAVPALAGLLNDPATARAAARALGRIGGPEALEALTQAKNPLAPAVLDARLAAARTDAATTVKVSAEIYRERAAPLAQRSAALRALIAADPAGAVEVIHTALIGSEPAFHQVAIESVVSVPNADTGTVLAGRLPTYSPAIQAALVASIAQRREAGAVSGVLALASASTDEQVRVAAIEALGRMPGSTETAGALVRVAATGEGGEAKAALASLARLDGPGIDGFVRAEAAAEGDTARRAVLIQLLAARNQTEALPFLFGLRQSPSDALRLKALDALRLIAQPSDQQALIEWALGTKDRTESARAVRAIITLILRDGATATRAAPVLAALESGDTATRLMLLPVLSRVGGAPAVDVAARLARAADDDVAMVATDELSRWRDASALPALVELISSTPRAAVRDAATQGAARFLAVRKNATPTQRSLYARQLLALPLDPVDRVAMVNVLSLCADEDALAAAKRFLAEPATAAAAQDAVDAITSNLAGPPAITASEAGDRTALITDGDRETFWSIPNAPGGWLRLDLHNSRPVRKITLDQALRERDSPRRMAVHVSDDPARPGAPLLEMEGENDQTIATLPAGTRGRYVWLRQNGTRPDNPWAIAELVVE